MMNSTTTDHNKWVLEDTVLGTTRPSAVFSAGTHESYTLVPTTVCTDYLLPIPMHPDEVHEFIAEGWMVKWQVMA